MSNPGSIKARSLTGPSWAAITITPSDTADLPSEVRGLYIGGAGNVRVLMYDDTATVDFIAVPVGSILPLQAKRVYSTGTTATNLIGLL